MDNTMEIENQIIYLVLRERNLCHELSVNDWNEFVDFYENDNESVAEPVTEDNEFGVCFAVTTNLFNILKKRSIYDLRFMIDGRSIYHTKEYPTEYLK